MIDREPDSLAKAEESLAAAESEFVNDRFVGDLTNRRKRYSSELRPTLEQNYRLRAMADYKRGRGSEIQAARAVRRAEVFVTAVAEHEGRAV
jgi:hypothetical protein